MEEPITEVAATGLNSDVQQRKKILREDRLRTKP